MDQDSLSTQNAPWIFPYRYFLFVPCFWFLQPLISCDLGATAYCSPPAYLVCDTLHSFDCEHFEHFYVDIIICSFLNLSYHVMGLSVVSFYLASFWYLFLCYR
ncbi:hypothetical protein BGY98DRAFT_655850 [Russula aff. rugulosa BPL654]|nr:hypothetical protein BGY98DRAFT_655850 [Russula aff. rugulosa BPL654]